ncbi:MAG: methylmalonyl Co-A mutase-associated GTPase MeaB [Syntrophaceae bacterium]|nr:methylmalonyl Co-A mutase-associated GTPase MeaB [Syntrophaceae bacterium]
MKNVTKILEGDVLAAATLMRGVEDEKPDAMRELGLLFPSTGRAHVIGLTGPPGVGKSTLIDSLIFAFRKKDLTVGVVAVDPTSPFTGGAVLGDRVRMQDHITDSGVFVRSMASRGWRGGLSKSTISMVHIMDAMGKDIVIVETVGVGQSEVEVTKIVDSSALVLSADSGDQVQIIKAGILEAADIFVVNKADKEGAGNVVGRVEFMLGMRERMPNSWKPSIVLTQAVQKIGADELADEFIKHKEYLLASGEMEKRKKTSAREELLKNVECYVSDFCNREFAEEGKLDEMVIKIAQRKVDPHTSALQIIDWLGSHFKHISTKK